MIYFFTINENGILNKDSVDLRGNHFLSSASIKTGDNHLAIVNSTKNSNRYLNLVSYNVQSFVLDTNSVELSNSGAMQLYGMLKNLSNSFFTIGSNYLLDQGVTNGLLIKSSSNDTLWVKNYSHPIYELSFSSIKKISEDRILVGGRAYDWDYNWQTIPENKWDDEHHTYIAELDTLGNIIWEWEDTTNFTWIIS